MSYEALGFWLTVVNMACTGVVAFYTWISNRNRVTQGRITALKDEVGRDLDKQGTRLTQVEERIKHLPASSMVERIGGDVRVVKAEVEGLRELLKPMQRTMELMNEFLLNQSK